MNGADHSADVELIDALTRLVEASKGTAAEHGAAAIVEFSAHPPMLLATATPAPGVRY